MTTKEAHVNPGTPAGGLRASDAERERTVEGLRKHYETGHLGYAEFNERIEHAYQATYAHQLTALVADLPGRSAHQPGVPATTPPPAPKERTGWGRIAAITALVIASLVGLSWLTGLVTSHPVISLLAVGAVVWFVVKGPRRRRDTA